MTPNSAAALRASARGIPFVARDIAGAVAEIRAKLGPEAVILSISRCPVRGLARLWQPAQVEVLACLPEAEAIADCGLPIADCQSESNGQSAIGNRQSAISQSPPPPSATIPQQEAMQRYARANLAAGSGIAEGGLPMADGQLESDQRQAEFGSLLANCQADFGHPPSAIRVPPSTSSPWRCAAVLERLGLTPLHVERVLMQMQELHGATRSPPESMIQELALARAALLRLWRPRPTPAAPAEAPLHVFIGPPGVGKSTVLCKWLAQTLLLSGQAAQVWRLDGRTADASEIVDVYAEILGVRVERSWRGRGDVALPGFVDLPSVDFQDAEALQFLGQTLAQFPGAQVHLVLNAAYTTTLLLAQARAFAHLPVTNLILTHLDEETAWGKLWNLVLGTNCALGYLSAGQNIPGRFCAAQAEALCAPLFGGK